MSGAPKWAQDMDTGIAGLVKDLESARDGESGVVDWPAIVKQARGLGQHLVAAEADYRALVTDANKRLAEASRQLQQQRGVGAGPGTANQTVYISAGATAGIAAGALVLGSIGGYVAKGFLENRKRKKAAEAEEAAAELPEGTETKEPKPKRKPKS